MITPPNSQMVSVLIQSRDELDATLDRAVRQIRSKAVADPPQGIIVTRHTYSEFTVCLSASVPYGETRELVDF